MNASPAPSARPRRAGGEQPGSGRSCSGRAPTAAPRRSGRRRSPPAWQRARDRLAYTARQPAGAVFERACAEHRVVRVDDARERRARVGDLRSVSSVVASGAGTASRDRSAQSCRPPCRSRPAGTRCPRAASESALDALHAGIGAAGSSLAHASPLSSTATHRPDAAHETPVKGLAVDRRHAPGWRRSERVGARERVAAAVDGDARACRRSRTRRAVPWSRASARARPAAPPVGFGCGERIAGCCRPPRTATGRSTTQPSGGGPGRCSSRSSSRPLRGSCCRHVAFFVDRHAKDAVGHETPVSLPPPEIDVRGPRGRIRPDAHERVPGAVDRDARAARRARDRVQRLAGVWLVRRSRWARRPSGRTC